jgi:hypothetical protein
MGRRVDRKFFLLGMFGAVDLDLMGDIGIACPAIKCVAQVFSLFS